MGFVRHLTQGEIVSQVLEAQRLLRAEGTDTSESCPDGHGRTPAQLRCRHGRTFRSLPPARNGYRCLENLGEHCGHCSRHRAIHGERLPYSLAISLHAATDEERSALLPVNQRWPLSELFEACRYYSTSLQRRVFLGWTLIAGKNDSPEQARLLIELLRGLDAHVNLIRLNTTAGFAGTTSAQESAHAFQKAIQDAGIPCTIRQFRGIDVAAGCGQLRAARYKERAKESQD
jgi:23S rRNA (adenine2503-C2)-methyltransferase